MSSPSPSASTDGRERFGRNVAFAWGGYMVNVVAGFIIPRMISDHLGQTTLGIWDFAWSFVSYIGLVQLGMGGSISRYVAKYRAQGDTEGLNRSVSTIAIFQRSVGWLALILAVASAVWVMPIFGPTLGDQLDTARWVLIFLGAEIALMITLSVYGSVIVGCHRWDVHNAVSAITYGLVAVGMIAVLLLGGGLPAIALVHCIMMVGSELVRWKISKKVCPELRIERSLASWKDFKELAHYSAKSLTPSISNLLSNQALSLLITAFLGPASLAVFSRSRSLMTTLRTLAAKFGMIVMPTASALQANNDRKALRETLISMSAIISSLVLPVLIVMGVLGDQLIRLWMGDPYVYHGLLPILCVGTYATLCQEPVWSLLSGMNAHGVVALVKLLAAILSVILLVIVLWWLQGDLLGTALCFVLPQLLVDGLFTPWYACRLVGVSKRIYLWQVFVRPILCIIPFAVGLEVLILMLSKQPLSGLVPFVAGGIISGYAYNRWLLPASLKAKLKTLTLRILPKFLVRRSL